MRRGKNEGIEVPPGPAATPARKAGSDNHRKEVWRLLGGVEKAVDHAGKLPGLVRYTSLADSERLSTLALQLRDTAEAVETALREMHTQGRLPQNASASASSPSDAQ